MPAKASPYVTQPFVGARYEDSGYGRTLAQLMLQRGDQQARLHLQRGDAAAQMWQGAGNAINQAVGGWQRSVEENRQRQLEVARESRSAEAQGIQITGAKMQLAEAQRQEKGRAFTRQVLPLARREDGLTTYDRNILTREFEAAGMSDQLPEVFAKLDEQDSAHLQVLAARRDAVAGDAFRVLQSGASAESFAGLVEYWKANDALPARELREIEKLGKDDKTRGQALMAAVQSSPKFTAMLKDAREANKPQLQVVAPGASVIDQRNPGAGALFTAPREEKPPMNLEDAILQETDPAKRAELIALKKDFAAAGRAPAVPRASEPLESVIGPDGRAVLVPRSEAAGKAPANVKEQTSTGPQKRTFQFFQRATQAEDDLAKVEEKISGLGLVGQTRLKYAPNFAQTDDGQLYDQAQRAFTEARLRKDSGAAIPDHEYANDRKTYFAEPGDTPAKLEQKRRARANILSSLAFESGRAVSEFYGEEAAGLLSSLRARAAGGKAETPTAGGDGWTVVDGIRIREKK